MRTTTGCPPLDDLLGGGLEAGAITLVYGEAGTGKTNLCLQTSHRALAEGTGKVGYLDTEGVSLERLEQIAGSDFERTLKNILFMSPQNLAEQDRMVRALGKIRKPALIVVDSINMHYRLLLGQDNERATQSITRQMGDLLGIARQAEVPVLITGQVYGDEDEIQPFGGRILQHIVKTIVRLKRVGAGRREAILVKHRSRPEGERGDFRITAHGLE